MRELVVAVEDAAVVHHRDEVVLKGERDHEEGDDLGPIV